MENLKFTQEYLKEGYEYKECVYSLVSSVR